MLSLFYQRTIKKAPQKSELVINLTTTKLFMNMCTLWYSSTSFKHSVLLGSTFSYSPLQILFNDCLQNRVLSYFCYILSNNSTYVCVSIPRKVHQRSVPFHEHKECDGYNQMQLPLTGFRAHSPVLNVTISFICVRQGTYMCT